MKPLPTLKKRRDFQKISRQGQKWVTASFILQASQREKKTHMPLSVRSSDYREGETLPLASVSCKTRIGYTVSKKVGNSVLRNKVKRRLRECAKIVFKEETLNENDYIIIARRGSDQTPFKDLVKELAWALKHLHRLLG